MAFSNNGDFVVGEARAYGFTRIDLRTQDIMTFLANTPDNSAGDPMGAEVGISPSGRYAAVAFNYIGSPKAYFRVVDVDSCSTHNAPSDINQDTCKQFNYLPLLQQKIPGLTQIYNIQFASDNAMSFVAKVGVGPTATYFRYEMSPLGQPTRLADYLALGDSFASGEGTFFYQTETDKSPNRCHLSIASYPYLLDKYVGVTHSVACSGAELHNITGQVKEEEQINQLGKTLDVDIPQYEKDHAELYRVPGTVAQTNFVNDDNPQIVTISVGGNDVGFSNIIKRCIIPFNKFTSTAQNCYQTYEDRLELVNLIDRQYSNLVKLYRNLNKADPTRRVYVLG
jgi:hypothetical protein